MKKIDIKNLLFILLSFGFFKINAQNTHQLTQVIEYYPSGNIKNIKNIILRRCYIFDNDIGSTIKKDTAYYGIFKEYYTNNVLKISGQYDCRFWDKNFDPKDTTDHLRTDCFKTGVWYEFDSSGKQTKVSLYDEEGYLVFDKYSLIRDTIKIIKDSTVFMLDEYEKKNSYLIKRYKTNKRLFLKFPTYSDHNYWYLFQKPMSTLIDREYRGVINMRKNLRLFSYIKYDDTPKNTDMMDFSTVKAGIYYLVYKTVGSYTYEVEIVLEDIE